MKKKQITIKNFAKIAAAFMTIAVTGLVNVQNVCAFSDANPGKVALKVAELKQQNVFKQQVEVFSKAGTNSDTKISQTVRKYSLLRTNSAFSEILNSKPEYLKLSLPSPNGTENFSLLLYKVDISSNGFTLITSSGRNQQVEVSCVNYRGVIENDNQSVVAITFSENETMGLISNRDGNYVLGKMQDKSSERYIIYNDKDLVPSSNIQCDTKTDVPENPLREIDPNQTTSVKCVNWYWETDYDIFVGKGSVANVTTYINAVFNQVSTLYANDGVSITLQTLFVWDTTDPYTGPDTGDYLDQFGTNRTSFTGNLAMLIGYNGGGGVAYVNGYCASTSHKMGYAGISSNYQSVPTYSWTVEVLTHEQGHLLGSSHTHDCKWNGNNTKIDACGDVAGYPSGSCAQTVPPTPAGGGTIMSYCHLTSAGINLSLGFGPQPAALILNAVNNSSCLTACSTCTPPAQPATISGSASVCQSVSQTYSVAAVSGATSYTWTKPSGWSGSSTTNSITLTTGSSGGVISVVANNACGSSTARTLTATVTSVPAQPASISGSASVCQSVSQTYSVAAVSGATSYVWTLPGGWSGSSSSNSITATTGISGGSISVYAANTCGNSTTRTLAVAVLAKPAKPGAITGASAVCANQQAVPYSISAVPGATSYTWTGPSGVRISDGITTSANNSLTTSHTNVTVNWKTTPGNFRVRSINGCGVSKVSVKAVSFTCREGMDAVEANEINIAPNPAHDQMNVSFRTSEENSICNISVRDLTGRVIYTISSNVNEGMVNQRIDVTNFSKGIYMLEVVSGSERTTKKFIVQ